LFGDHISAELAATVLQMLFDYNPRNYIENVGLPDASAR
jgi:hypothetical protein